MRKCIRCKTNRAIYNVTSPNCFDSLIVPMCPACLQDGINMGEIVWIGDKPVGICSECEAA